MSRFELYSFRDVSATINEKNNAKIQVNYIFSKNRDKYFTKNNKNNVN